MTADNDGLILGLALNYSGRVEIEDIVKKIVLELKDGKIGYEDISQRGADLPLIFGPPHMKLISPHHFNDCLS